MAHAAALGATITKPVVKVFSGGDSGYIRDLDGHLWEVARNPDFALPDRICPARVPVSPQPPAISTIRRAD